MLIQDVENKNIKLLGLLDEQTFRRAKVYAEKGAEVLGNKDLN